MCVLAYLMCVLVIYLESPEDICWVPRRYLIGTLNIFVLCPGDI